MRIRRLLKIGIAVGSISLILTGCSSSEESIAERDRYKMVDRVLIDIDYQNIGTIKEERQDSSKGDFAPSHKTIEYEGEEPYSKIVERLENSMKNYECSYDEKERSFDCMYNNISISAGRAATFSVIKVTDPDGGRSN
jgi:hypothetical protein